jgi:hypothetical protein
MAIFQPFFQINRRRRSWKRRMISIRLEKRPGIS